MPVYCNGKYNQPIGVRHIKHQRGRVVGRTQERLTKRIQNKDHFRRLDVEISCQDVAKHSFSKYVCQPVPLKSKLVYALQFVLSQHPTESTHHSAGQVFFGNPNMHFLGRWEPGGHLRAVHPPSHFSPPKTGLPKALYTYLIPPGWVSR